MLSRQHIILTLCLLACSIVSKGAEKECPQDIVILGDSNIWLAGDSCDNHQGWTAWFRDYVSPRSMCSYARSGASWSHTAQTKANPEENIAVLGDDNVIYNQVIRLVQAYNEGVQPYPTVILLAAGGNDAWFNNKRPEEFSETPEEAMAHPTRELLSRTPDKVLSLPVAIRYDCMLLQTVFPEATLILLTPTPMSKVEPQMLAKVCNLIERTASAMDLPTVRLDLNGPINRDDEMREHVNTYDGIHTSEIGASRVGRFVADKISPMICK